MLTMGITAVLMASATDVSIVLVSIVLSIYSVSGGDYLNALAYSATE